MPGSNGDALNVRIAIVGVLLVAIIVIGTVAYLAADGKAAPRELIAIGSAATGALAAASAMRGRNGNGEALAPRARSTGRTPEPR